MAVLGRELRSCSCISVTLTLEAFMALLIDHYAIGKKLYRLEIRHDGRYIGEYERSQADDIERKKEEVRCAADPLLRVYQQCGEFKVRWNGDRREKVVFVQDIERAVIPRSCWRPPSWVR